MVWMWFSLGVLGLALGVTLIALGRRGRRVNDHPICRRCRFDLVGLPTHRPTCPECGASLARRRAVMMGERRPRMQLTAAGVLVVMLVVLPAAVLVSGGHLGLNRYKPLELLLFETRFANSLELDEIALELNARITRNALDKEEMGRVMDVGLGLQADLRRPWAVEWGEVMDDVRLAQGASDEQIQRYFAQAPVIALEARPRVTAGETLPLRVRIVEGRIGRSSAGMLPGLIWNSTVAGQPWYRPMFGQHASGGSMAVMLDVQPVGSPQKRFSAYRHSDLVVFVPATTEPGVREVVLEVAFAEGGSFASILNRGARPGHLSKVTASFEVLPVGQSSVEVVKPTPALERAVRAALRPPTIVASADAASDSTLLQLSFNADTDTLPMGVVGEVFLKRGDREIPAGFTFSEDWGRTDPTLAQTNPMRNTVRRLPFRISPGPVTVIIRPRPDLAAQTLTTDRMYGAELTIEAAIRSQ